MKNEPKTLEKLKIGMNDPKRPLISPEIYHVASLCVLEELDGLFAELANRQLNLTDFNRKVGKNDVVFTVLKSEEVFRLLRHRILELREEVDEYAN